MAEEDKIAASITRHFKTIFPFRMNHHETLFGGLALQWMDEVAFITATRFCRQRLVTVSSEKVDFLQPIQMGDFAEVVGKIDAIGNSSLKVLVEVYIEKMYEEGRQLAIRGVFSFVALGDDNKPEKIKN